MGTITRLSVLAAAGLVAFGGCGSATAPAGAERFEVPTFDWDRSAGMQALISGRIALTDDGCTLMVPVEGDGPAQAVIFPNAEGVRFGNGVRAVVESGSGKVYATEGQTFSYAGGFVPEPNGWTSLCGSFAPDDVGLVNDLPAFPVPTADPDPYDGTLPTEIPSLAERGWYAVPTFEWDPADGGDAALLEGTVSMTDDGCATVESADGVVGLVLPNAWGKHPEGDAGGVAIYSWFPDSSGLMAEEGLRVSYGGGFTELTSEFGEQWQTLCPDSPVDALFVVQDDQPWD